MSLRWATVAVLAGTLHAPCADPAGPTALPTTEVVRRADLERDWSPSRDAAERGLRFLKDHQKESGAVGSRYAVAATSLAGLAALGAGHQPNQEPHGGFLLGCLRYVLTSADPRTGFITESGESESRMHGHAYAILFLSEILGSLPPEKEPEVLDALKRGVRVIENAQSTEGGWYYTADPAPQDDEASVTVCALQALRGARNAGILVDSRRIDRAIHYVMRCQHADDGSFAYSTKMPEKTSYALTVAAISTLNAAGVYDSAKIRLGLDYLRRRLERASAPWRAAEEEYDFYANLYAAQTYFQQGGELWKGWFPRVREHLLRTQRADGAWVCRFGDEYGTAVAVLILEVPLGYLPIFQR